MNKYIMEILCDPVDRSDLSLENPVYDELGHVMEGYLVSRSNHRYKISKGIPRFADASRDGVAVQSFGEEWNFFNFDQFKQNWLNHTVRNTFGSVNAFKDKVIVDAGGGSGMQTLWMLQNGAKHVVMMELSNSVDDVVQRNLGNSGYSNYDVIQCSIDRPPLKSDSINGIVICHNVIQHTSNVEKTAHALFDLVAPGGEFVFNCYPLNNEGLIRNIRWEWYKLLRGFLQTRSFAFRLLYSRIMGILSFIPLVGLLLEKSYTFAKGEVVRGNESYFSYLKRQYRAVVLNTFDCYGSHKYQHHKTDQEIMNLTEELQPEKNKILNMDKYFSRPQPIGCALRIFK